MRLSGLIEDRRGLAGELRFQAALETDRQHQRLPNSLGFSPVPEIALISHQIQWPVPYWRRGKL